MNNLHPYEKHLSERLQQVPVPDKEAGWVEMRKLLDREMPAGGGGWGGNRKWWWMGLTVAIIIAGVWTSQQFNEREKALQAISNANSVSENNNTTKPLAENQVNEKRVVEQGTTNSANSVSTKEAAITPNQVEAERTSLTKETNKSGQENRKNQQVSTAPKADKGFLDVRTTFNQKLHSKNNGRKLQSNSSPNSQVAYINNSNLQDQSKRTELNDNLEKPTGTTVTESLFVSAANARAHKTPEEMAFVSSSIAPSKRTEEVFQDPEDAFVVISPDQEHLKAEPGKTDKVFAKEMRKKSIKEDNRKISGKSMRGMSSEKDHELTFAAGLSLPQSFAIGAQQSPSYGVNAKPGKVSDYVPVPFFQYHLNNRVFLQTELQFQSPQFTDRLLISQSQYAIAPTNGLLERNIYVEKLYYFHIPFNVYFSPVRNLYFGSGIQYSSLISGVATYQDNRYTNGTLENSNSRVQGFKDDSVAAKLAPTEWRYQLEANYYFNRFTFGARYNQALSQFVNLQPSPTLPFTQGRNQSFLLYLRFNIWEERKKSLYYANSW